jgi:hypothetical protein
MKVQDRGLTMQTEVGTDIPSPQDYLDAVTARMVDSAMSGDPDPEVLADLAAMMTTETFGDGDMLNLIAFAQGCHAAAKVYRNRNSEAADLYFSLGQDLIVRAMDMFAVLMAVGIAQMGVTKH